MLNGCPVTCPHCQAAGQLADSSLLGRPICCPACHQIFDAPLAVAAPQAVNLPQPGISSRPRISPGTMQSLQAANPATHQTMPVSSGEAPTAIWVAKPRYDLNLLDSGSEESESVLEGHDSDHDEDDAAQIVWVSTSASKSVFTVPAPLQADDVSSPEFVDVATKNELAPNQDVHAFMAAVPLPGEAEFSFVQNLPEPKLPSALGSRRPESKLIVWGGYSIAALIGIGFVFGVATLWRDPIRAKAQKPVMQASRP